MNETFTQDVSFLLLGVHRLVSINHKDKIRAGDFFCFRKKKRLRWNNTFANSLVRQVDGYTKKNILVGKMMQY